METVQKSHKSAQFRGHFIEIDGIFALADETYENPTGSIKMDFQSILMSFKFQLFNRIQSYLQI